MQCEKDDGWPSRQSSGTKKVLEGEPVHPYYYLAVILYLVGKAKDAQMVTDFFNDLNNLFVEFSHKPP